MLIILLGMAFTYDASNVIRMHAERTVRITSMEEFWPLNSVTRFPGLYDAIGPVDTEDEKWGIAHTYGESRRTLALCTNYFSARLMIRPFSWYRCIYRGFKSIIGGE